MKDPFKFEVSIGSWVLAVVFLSAFCWLGFAAIRFGSTVQGLGVSLPIESKLAFSFGPMAFPLVGIAAAAVILLSDVLFQRRRVQWVLMAVLVLFFVLAFRALIVGGVFMGPIGRANQAHGLKDAVGKARRGALFIGTSGTPRSCGSLS